MQHFFQEVLRRKVLPVAAAYAIGGWVLPQVGDVLIGLLELPGWLGKMLVALSRERYVTRISLRRFTREDVRSLIDGTQQAPSAL